MEIVCPGTLEEALVYQSFYYAGRYKLGKGSSIHKYIDALRLHSVILDGDYPTEGCP